MVLRAPRRGKQVSRYQPEPGEYVAGQEGIALFEQNRLIRRCMNRHRALPGVDRQPRRVPAWKYSASFRFISALVLLLLKISTARSGARSGVGLPGRSRPGSLSQEVNAASEMSLDLRATRVAVWARTPHLDERSFGKSWSRGHTCREVGRARLISILRPGDEEQNLCCAR